MASASATELASGFSHSTCLPASNAAIAIWAWVSPGVQMSTRSTSSRVITSRQSVALEAQPSLAAAAAARSASRPTTTAISGDRGRSKKRGAVRQACEWAAPMNACPTIATRSGAVMQVLQGWAGAALARGPGGRSGLDQDSKALSMYWSTLSAVTTGAESLISRGTSTSVRSDRPLSWASRRASRTPSAAWLAG